MRTILLEQPFHLKQVETAAPSRGSGEALVRVRRIGVCGTDLHAFRGRQPYFTYPRILGHELAVEVVDVDAKDGGVDPGDRCVVMPYLSCGTCVACRAGKTNCCTQLKVLGVHVDGGMTDMISLPVANLIPAAGLSLEQMALVENQSIGAHAVRRAAPLPGETALVVGGGPIGLGVIQAAKARGARVIVADVSPSRLDFCSRYLGVDAVIDARGDALAELARATSGDLAPVVFDATGNPESMERSFAFVASGGRLVFVGLVQADIKVHDPEFHRRELTLLASRNATREDFDWVMEAMRRGDMVTEPLITHRVAFDDLVDSFAGLLDPEAKVIKAMVEL